ncbi:hypothetical protein ACFOGJ_12645 [Marinibaculum pumilum]|uniref:Uncharacterized protein n=1 Tax=Marinibaculum pumilum TaxID=1766165 RepID=A0ABV7L0G8_9PROT
MADIWYLRDREWTATTGPVRRHGAEAVFEALGWQGWTAISADPAGSVRAGRPGRTEATAGQAAESRHRVVVRIGSAEAGALSALAAWPGVAADRRPGPGYYTWPDLPPTEAERRFDAFGLPRVARRS